MDIEQSTLSDRTIYYQTEHGNFFVDPADEVVGREILRSSTWEPEISRLVQSRIKTGDLVLDIGAHIGWYSVLAAEAVGSAGSVIAVEPEPRNFELLSRNLELNNCSQQVSPYRLAISDRDEEVLFERCDTNQGDSRIRRQDSDTIPAQMEEDDRPVIQVKTVTLDGLMEHHIAPQLLDKSISLMKVDTQGSEVLIFRRGHNTLGRVQVLVAEYAPYLIRRLGCDPAEYWELLKQHFSVGTVLSIPGAGITFPAPPVPVNQLKDQVLHDMHPQYQLDLAFYKNPPAPIQLSSPRQELTTYAGACLTEFMRIIYLSRPDIKKRFSISDILSRTVFLTWCHIYGRDHLKLSPSNLPQPQWDLLNDNCEEIGLCEDHSLTRMQVVLWLASSASKEAFNLNQLPDRLCVELLVAVLCDKPQSVRSVLPSKKALLFADTADPAFQADIPISVCYLMSAVWEARKDLQIAFPQGSRENSAALVLWFLNHGMKELDLSSIDIAALDRQYLLSSSPDLQSDLQIMIPRVLHQIWCSSTELQAQYDLHASQGRLELLSWFKERGVGDYGLGWLFTEPSSLSVEQTHSESVSAATKSSDVDNTGDCELEIGLNIIGNAQGGFGMSQHAIMTALAAQCAGIPCAIVDTDSKTTIENSGATKLGCAVVRTCSYSVNIAAFTANNLPDAFGTIGLPMLQLCHNIYYGNWEFQQYPSDHAKVIDSFDEIWAPSKFTFEALQRTIRSPLYYVPLAVTVPNPLPATRADFNLPDDSFLFLNTFDFHAGILRKNPIACVQAFIEAFPEDNKRVCLLIKTKNVNSNVTEDYQAWMQLKQLAKLDGRVRIIDAGFSRDKMASLVNLCDAFVSLHRAEGFGLAMAEAMLMGKPVIATNYSGNTEFTLDFNSCPVNNVLVRPPDAVLRRIGVETTWADPDISQAASYMGRLVADQNYRKDLGECASQYISQNYNPSAVGQIIKRRLDNIPAQKAVHAKNFTVRLNQTLSKS